MHFLFLVWILKNVAAESIVAVYYYALYYDATDPQVSTHFRLHSHTVYTLQGECGPNYF